MIAFSCLFGLRCIYTIKTLFGREVKSHGSLLGCVLYRVGRGDTVTHRRPGTNAECLGDDDCCTNDCDGCPHDGDGCTDDDENDRYTNDGDGCTHQLSNIEPTIVIAVNAPNRDTNHHTVSRTIRNTNGKAVLGTISGTIRNANGVAVLGTVSGTNRGTQPMGSVTTGPWGGLVRYAVRYHTRTLRRRE